MRRRKPRVVWLPQTNANSIGDGTQVYQSAIVSYASAPTGSTGIIELPLVSDATANDPLDPLASLSDIENTGYRLRRIVGKIWVVGNLSTNLQDRAPMSVVTAGIIVRRYENFSGASLAAVASAPNDFELIDPGKIDNTMDPWIWRRSWIIGDPGALSAFRAADGSGGITVLNETPGITNFGAGYPGGIAEGPHVDQKTARIIGPEERLFLDISATVLVEGDDQLTNAIQVVTDLRVLGSMRTSSGNRRNASR